MAYDYDLGGMGSAWLDQILGGPMTGYGTALGGQMTGAAGGYLGSGGLPTFEGFGNSSLGGMYGGGGGYGGGGLGGSYGLSSLYSQVSPLDSLLYNLPTYGAPQARQDPWAGLGAALPLSLGAGRSSGYGGSYQSPYQSPGAQRTAGYGGQAQAQAPQQGYGQPQQQGYGQPQQQQRGAAQPQQGQQQPQQGGGGSGQYASPLPDGGVYGAQKWSSSMGSNAVDIFVRRGTPVYAPVSGTLQQGQNGQLILQGDGGLSFAFRHGQTTASGHVQRGQQIGVVNDPGMDTLGRPGFGQMPDGYQHLELSVSQGNYFPGTPGGGGSIDAAQWLESIGYRGQKMARTPGPPDAQGGGGGMGGGMFGGMPGMGGMGGMGGGMGQMGGMPSIFGGMGGSAGGGQFGGSLGGMPGGFGGFGQGGFGQQFGGYGGFGGFGR